MEATSIFPVRSVKTEMAITPAGARNPAMARKLNRFTAHMTNTMTAGMNKIAFSAMIKYRRSCRATAAPSMGRFLFLKAEAMKKGLITLLCQGTR